jgi:hypothetical protein|tara:strand:- start:3911 stop:4114 length:204 start_codon:yes stop_codon:yes gene_type:complete
MPRPSLLSEKEGKPLSFVAAVRVIVAVAAYLKALDMRKLDTTEQLSDLREAYNEYRECIEINARYKK